MTLFKRLLKSPPIQDGLAFIASLYLTFVFKTTRWHWVNAPYIQDFWDKKQPFMPCFWHNRMMLLPFIWRKKTMAPHILISAHRDGRLIAKTVDHLGVGTITGSASKGGMAAVREILKTLARGECVAITPDGPKGPRHHAKMGIIQTARLAGVPILPLSYSIKRRIVLSSWDKLIIPLPFSRGVFIMGAPLTVPDHVRSDDLEPYRLELEHSLNDIANEGDFRCGHRPLD